MTKRTRHPAEPEEFGVIIPDVEPIGFGVSTYKGIPILPNYFINTGSLIVENPITNLRTL